MSYKFMRFQKYYDSLRTNKSFFKTSLSQKYKILLNILRFMRVSSKKPQIIHNKPVTAQIETTSCCNLQCETCVRDKIGVPIGTMSFENFKKILDQLDSLFKVYLSGQGEPLLNKDLFKMVEYANKKGVLVNINTNAMLLTKEVIDKITKTDIGEIGISIDSTKKEKFEKIRKGAKFETVIDNVKNLSSALKKNKRKSIITFAVIVLKDNLDEILDFIRLAHETGADKVVFQTIQVKEDYFEKYDEKTKKMIVSDLMKEIKDRVGDAMKMGKKYGVTVIFDEGGSNGAGCIWPWRGIYVTWNGYVTACCKILDYRNPLMGNLLEQDFWDVWNSQNYQLFRSMLKDRVAHHSCKGCGMV